MLGLMESNSAVESWKVWAMSKQVSPFFTPVTASQVGAALAFAAKFNENTSYIT